MPRRLLTSLRHKVMGVVLFTTAFALCVSAATMLIYELQTYKKGWITDLQTQADIVAHASASALVFGDQRLATESLSWLRLRPQIKAGAVYRRDGSLFATYQDAGEPSAAFPPSLSMASPALSDQSIEVFRPIRQNGDVLGTVYLRAGHDIAGRVRDYVFILFGITLFSMVVAGMVLNRLQRTITTPILAVTKVAREVMLRRDFSLRAPKTSGDEVGVLVDAFNDMLAEAGARNDALARSNQQLTQEMAQRRVAEEALSAAIRKKDEFIATLAHELRNPLAPISNAVEILRHSAGDGPSPLRSRALNIMNRQLRQMVRLIDDLMDVSRITTGKLWLHQDDNVDLVSVLHAALETASPNIQERGHRLEVVLPSRAVFIRADAVRLVQVFANLLNNAAKYTPNGGRIELSLSVEGAEAIVTVADDGVGIDPEVRDSIFNLFVQVEPPLERGKAGLGVGLSLARSLVELHGGRIHVRSAGLGRGAEFKVSLPIHTPARDLLNSCIHHLENQNG